MEAPRLDAELLLAEATGRDRARLAADPDARVEADAARRFGAMVRRRVAREPVAYILGRKGFRRLELAVDARVLIPRPETELLVEAAVELAPRGCSTSAPAPGGRARGRRRARAGGSRRLRHILEALAVAKANRDRIGLGERVRLIEGSYPAEPGFDLVLANLPYVGDGEWEGLAPEIARFEPRGALVAGPTGLEAIDALLGAVATRALRTRAVALEVGVGQAATVAELVRRAGFELVEKRRDLAGIERVVLGR